MIVRKSQWHKRKGKGGIVYDYKVVVVRKQKIKH